MTRCRNQCNLTNWLFIHTHLFDTYLLLYSMVQSPSWEANWFAASQEIPRISPNPKVHYRTHKRPPPISILGQPNPVHIPTSHLLEIHPNIIHPSTPRSPQWSPSLRFPQQDPITKPIINPDNCPLLGYYAASSGNSLPTFRDGLKSWPLKCNRQVVQKSAVLIYFAAEAWHHECNKSYLYLGDVKSERYFRFLSVI